MSLVTKRDFIEHSLPFQHVVHNWNNLGFLNANLSTLSGDDDAPLRTHTH